MSIFPFVCEYFVGAEFAGVTGTTVAESYRQQQQQKGRRRLRRRTPPRASFALLLESPEIRYHEKSIQASP